MKVDIKHTQIEKGRFIKKTFYEVAVSIVFSEEELHIIRDRNLGDYVILERYPADAKNNDRPEWFTLHIKNLVARPTDRHNCDTPASAKQYENDLVAQLKVFKDFIQDNAELASSSSFEL